jgi:hypothetical protein
MLQIYATTESESVSHTTIEMSKEKAAKALNPSASAPGVVITELNNFDVLLGRGMPILKQTGNNRFRTSIANHRDEYRAVNRHTHKDEIARRIMLTIRALGGRFLRTIESAKDKAINNIDENVPAWVVVDEETSLQKVKQALRELPWNSESAKKRKNAKRSLDSVSSHSAGSQLLGEPFDPISQDAMYQKINLETRLQLLHQNSAHAVLEIESCGDTKFPIQKRRSVEWAQFRGLPQSHFNTAPLPSFMEEHSKVAMMMHAERRGAPIKLFESKKHRDPFSNASLGTVFKQAPSVSLKKSSLSSCDDEVKPQAKPPKLPATMPKPKFGS